MRVCVYVRARVYMCVCASIFNKDVLVFNCQIFLTRVHSLLYSFLKNKGKKSRKIMYLFSGSRSTACYQKGGDLIVCGHAQQLAGSVQPMDTDLKSISSPQSQGFVWANRRHCQLIFNHRRPLTRLGLNTFVEKLWCIQPD